MLGVALYYGITGSSNIKLLPVSLCAVALLSAFGPWGAYAVAERSQLGRFNRILAANGMGKAGAIVRAERPVAFADRRELSAILRYLRTTRGPEAVARAMGVPEDSLLAWSRIERRGSDDPGASRALERVGLAYVSQWVAIGLDERAGSDGSHFWANVQPPQTLEVSGFDVTRVMSYPALGWIGTTTDSVQLVREGDAVVVKRAGAELLRLDVAAAVHDAIPEDSLLQRGSGPLARPILVEGAGGGVRVRWVIDQVTGRVVAGKLQLQSANGAVLVGGLRTSVEVKP
jgi:hypothetical protein